MSSVISKQQLKLIELMGVMALCAAIAGIFSSTIRQQANQSYQGLELVILTCLTILFAIGAGLLKRGNFMWMVGAWVFALLLIPIAAWMVSR